MYSIEFEYRKLLDSRRNLDIQIKQLPQGYISEKNIRGSKQYYLQRRVGDKISGTYIKASEVQNVRAALAQRAACEAEIKQIELRLEQLEQAAKLIGKNLYCKFMMMKLSVGMDDLNVEQRKLCSSFGTAMNAVEGVMISEETAAEIHQWHRGEKAFQTVFENVLRHYGFPTEGTV